MVSYHKNPDLYWSYLEEGGHIDRIYEVIRRNDLVELSLTVFEILKQSNTMPNYDKHVKSEYKSNILRETGSKSYGFGQYRTALEFYNKALSYAPENSKAMKLAYNSRSTLLFKVKAYAACLNDIETCIAMGCNKDITEKLKDRKEQCQRLIWREKEKYSNYSKDFFKLDSPRHPDVPYVSTDVDITRDNSNMPTVAAAKDIKIGTIIALEPAFTSVINPLNRYLCCYYCHKMSLNLKPCRDCWLALFCDDKCEYECMEESHKVECHLTPMLDSSGFGPCSRMTFRTILKIKQTCKTWKEFVAASYSVGEERMMNSSINQIYDRQYPFCMLCFPEQREVKIGSRYNFAFICASFLKQLMDIPSFFPYPTEEKNEAIQAVARMCMKLLLLFYNKIELKNIAVDSMTQHLKALAPNYGYFAFASKLKHCCDANLLVIALNNKIALMALQPIKKGNELTISYVDHAYEFMHNPLKSQSGRIVELYRFGTLCHCAACTGTYKLKPRKLNKTQKKCFEKWFAHSADTADDGNKTVEDLSKNLEVLNGMSHTKEHNIMFTKWRATLLVFQFLATQNYYLSDV